MWIQKVLSVLAYTLLLLLTITIEHFDSTSTFVFFFVFDSFKHTKDTVKM